MSVQVKNEVAVFSAFLEQMAGDTKGRVYQLQASRLTVGRSSECDIVVEMEGVSRVHALIVNSQGSWFIRDNNSKNGVYVNGKQVKESWLESGDMVQMGTFLFRFDSGQLAQSPNEGNLPGLAGVGGAMELGMQAQLDEMSAAVPGAATGKKAGRRGNPRMVIYLVVLLLAGGYLMLSPTEETSTTTEQTAAEANLGGEGSPRDFKLSEKPTLKLGTKQPIPATMEDPLLKKAEQEMAKLDWSNLSLREAEQLFRRGEREYLSKNYHRAIESFRAALQLFGGHLLAEQYLRKARFEAEVEAKTHMATAIRYYESLQYARAIHHFNEVIALLDHKPDEMIVKTAKNYIKQSELRLQAAELFP